MQLHNSKIRIAFIVLVVIGAFLCPCHAEAGSDLYKTTNDDISMAFEAFKEQTGSDDEETRNLLKRWNEHLIAISRFSNADHWAAIKTQQLEYYKAISLLSEKIEETKQYRKQYSSNWVADLKRNFGAEFVLNNRNAIMDNFGAIISRSYHQYDDELKELIYIETMLYGSYKEYFNSFNKFYENELAPDEQLKLKFRKDAADNLLNLIDQASITQMHENLVLSERMMDNRAKKHSKKLFEFFSKHTLSKHFEISKASDDLNDAIRSYKRRK